MGDLVWNFARSEWGITAIEYGLIAALIAMAIVAAVGILGNDLSGMFTTVASSL